ncbi:MAG: ATP-binding cassette domain-containing protein [bacterium]|nr:ATP-binding cassette domain-containing protein [bacterium]
MPSPASESVLRFEDVTLRFEDEVVLNNVSFELSAGESCVVLGAAGSGKTVLLKSALGLLTPDEGRVCLFGEEITSVAERDMADIRAKVGILFQEGGLFDSLTIEENVGYPLVNQATIHCPPGDVHGRVEEALQFVELGHTLEKFPSELSGGMRRRVGIARANVTEPPLVLYDSPTAGLDPITAHTIMALIVKERDTKNTTTAMVTHRYQDGHLLANYRYNAETGRLVRTSSNGSRSGLRTRFLVMKEGRLVFEGAEDELHASPDPYVQKFFRRLES